MDNEISNDVAKDELEAPIVLTPDQIAAVAGGMAAATITMTNGGHTMGIMPPPPPPNKLLVA